MLGAQLNGQFGAQGTLVILGELSSTLTAAGTNQATALALTASTNVFTTVGAGTGGRLPVCSTSDTVRVANYGANALAVYPPSGGKMNNASANVPAMIAPNKAAEFVSIDGTSYMVILSA